MVVEYFKGIPVGLSKNFKSTEFDCHGKGCCSSTYIDEKLVNILQQIRDKFGAAVTINSGYRCSVHNKAVGGANSSKHMVGTAADIVVKGIEPKEVAKFAESIGVLGIGLYKWGCHIDTRTVKSFWYESGQEPRTTFGGSSNRNPVVVEWQKAAINDGYSLPSGADGIWGKECEAVAKHAICKRCYWPWKNKNLTKVIQSIVGVEPDGKFGAATKEAVKTYQALNGLTDDGVVGLNTWKRMLGV